MAASSILFPGGRWQLVFRRKEKMTILSSSPIRQQCSHTGRREKAFRYTQIIHRHCNSYSTHTARPHTVTQSNTAWSRFRKHTHITCRFVCGCLRACSFGLHLHPIRASIRSLCDPDGVFSLDSSLRFLFFTTICCACQYRPIIALIILAMFRLFSAKPVVVVVKATPRKVCGILFIFFLVPGWHCWRSLSERGKHSRSLSVNRFYMRLLNSWRVTLAGLLLQSYSAPTHKKAFALA